MKFKVDENLPGEVRTLLAGAGYEAATTGEEGLTSAPDHRIAEHCRAEDRILITFDLDFADIWTYPPSQYPGFIVLRLHRQDKPHVLSVFAFVLDEMKRESATGKLWIVEEHRIRIRG